RPDARAHLAPLPPRRSSDLLVPRSPDADEQRLRIVPEERALPAWKIVASSLAELIRGIDAFVGEVEPVLERIALLSPSGVDATLFLAKQLEALAGRLSAIALDLTSFLGETSDFCRCLSFCRR